MDQKAAGKNAPPAELEAVMHETCLRDRDDGLDYVWSGGANKLLPGCGGCKCCWREVAWDTNSVRWMPDLPGIAMNAQDKPRTFMEKGFEYPGGTFRIVPEVSTAFACSVICKQARACTSWTWSAAGTDDALDCALKSQTFLARRPKPGSVSGTVSPRQHRKPGGAGSAGGSKTIVSWQLQLRDGDCLDGGGRVPHIWRCDSNSSSQQWSIDLGSGRIMSLKRRACLVANGTRIGAEVVFAPCDQVGNDLTEWHYDSSSGFVRLAHGGRGCLTLTSDDAFSAVAKVESCEKQDQSLMRWEARRVLAPRAKEWVTYYVYRAQSDVSYPNENINAADLAGVMWYLHHEVVTMCPRKYNISRIKRIKVVSNYDEAIPFVAFDGGVCSVPNCDSIYADKGFRVGCQHMWYGGIMASWFSLPGACPSRSTAQKDLPCMYQQPGGACNAPGGGHSGCFYHTEEAGWISIDHLTGIDNYTKFCEDGSMEFIEAQDCGKGMSFWDGWHDEVNAKWRLEQVEQAFARKYPGVPTNLDKPVCNR